MTGQNKIQSNKPFRVPDNYFDEVSSNLYRRVSDTGDINNRTRLIRLLKPALMLAAAMIILAVISYTGLKLLFPEYERANGINHTVSIYGFEEAELIDKLTETGAVNDILSTEQEEIITYLLDHNIEYEPIIELLNQEI
ncbi:MAG: hypothetical protein KFF49_11755 [Bacteroidales bacterium]|nr:hypothetical protein [Bacteroidales bacterium]